MSKRFKKIYLEISNVCNLSCAFCPGTTREPKIMSEEELLVLLPKLRPFTDFLYFHLMGEPLCHPKLERFLSIAHGFGFRVIITTNGVLLKQKQEILLSSEALHKINVSLHAFEANDFSIPFEDYLDACLEFGKSAEGKKIVVYRLWNDGGQNELNSKILSHIKKHFTNEWTEERRGTRIGDKVYIEHGDRFDWPALSANDGGEHLFCYALRDQIGVLVDGTVVPCCLDHNGELALGDLFSSSLDEILDSKRARAIYSSFTNHKAAEPLCRRCGYARRFV